MGAEGTDKAQKATDLPLDCYAVLGVGPNAEETVIHEAFESLALKYDPEHFAGSADEAHRKLSNLASAYAILSDPVRRRRYDLRRRIDALIAPPAANEAPRRKGPPLAIVGRSHVAPPGPRQYQLLLPAVLGALIVVAIAAAYQYSGRPKVEQPGSGPAAPPVAADAKPASITQPTPPPAMMPAQPSDAGASGVITLPADPQTAATLQQETRPAPPKPAVAKSPPGNRAADAPAAVASESCSDVATVLGLCKRKSTVKDK